MRLLAFALAAAGARAQEAGPDLILNTCGPSAAAFQSWVWNASNSKFFLTATKGNNPPMCMDIANFNTDPGAEVYTWSCGEGSRQNEQWVLTGSQIKSAQTPATCLAAAGSSVGSSVTTNTCNTADQMQAFVFDAASGTITHSQSGLCIDAGTPVPPIQWCAQPPQSGWTICDTSASLDDRAADIVSRLSLADKIKSLVTTTPALSSVNLPSYQWWSEATHGISGPGVHYDAAHPGASNTALPITTSCSFNRSLWFKTGNQIAREGRAFKNIGLAGSTFWTPVINIVRDPRWGRNLETAGEDPFQSGEYAVSFVQGFEHATETPYPLQASACCKHFVANELDQWNTSDRYHFDAFVPQQDLVDSYLPSFQACVEEGKASGIMCSYNAVNGVPSCANDWLLGTLLRDSWEFDGYVTSDCDADSDVFNSHHYTPTASQAVAVILRAGTDVDCGGFMTDHAAQALTDGNITVGDIDTVLRRLFRLRLRLGHFDPPGVLERIGMDQVCTDYAVELARDGVRQSAVVVKNSAKTLPLDVASFSNPVVIGPNMDYTGVTGYYGGQPCVLPSGQYFTPLDAIKQHIPSATGIRGVPSVGSDDRTGIPAAAAAAAAADLVFLSVGSNLDLESEGKDRTSIAFSDAQQALITAVLAAVKPGTPVVALVQSGGAMDLTPILSAAGIGAALHLGQPSVQIVGAGDVVFGKTLDGRLVAPAGRMNQQSYPASYTSAVSMYDFGMRPGPSAWPPGTNPGRTYRFYTGTPVLPFGFGLSYTTWVYTPLPDPMPPVSLAGVEAAARLQEASGVLGHISAAMKETVAQFWVNVTNTGTVDSDDVVLGFLVPPGAGVDGVPLNELFGFERVFVPAGQTVTVYLGAQGTRFTQAGTDGVRRVLRGNYKVRFGVRETAELGMGFAEMSFTAE